MNINELLQNEEMVKFIESQTYRYWRSWGIYTYIEYEDFLQDIWLRLIPKLGEYDEERGAFTTFFTWKLKSFCSQVVRGANRKKEKSYERANEIMSSQLLSNDSGEYSDDRLGFFGTEDIGDLIEDNILIEEIYKDLDEVSKKALKLTLEGYKKKEIAKICNRSQQWVGVNFMNKMRLIARRKKLMR